MVSKESIERIIGKAVQAPSGDNAQPWKFKVTGGTIDLYNIPGKDNSPYNFKERGSFFAHGAVIENIAIAASSMGYQVAVSLFPTSDQNHIATITLHPSVMPVLRGTQDELRHGTHASLFESIETRTTNRKSYQKKPLLKEDLQAIDHVASSFGFGKLTLLQDPLKIKEVGNIISLSDQLIFEDRTIHDAIFDSIRWTEQEEEIRRGLYIKTLELPPPAQVIFKLLRSWPMLVVMNHVKISKFIASQSAQVYGASSAIGMVTITGDTPADFVNAGRLFERIWLTATAQGVSVQPITAIAYLDQRIREKEANKLSSGHQVAIAAANRTLRSLFGNPEGTVAMIFRMGYGGTPSARSKKSLAEIAYTD